MKAHNGHLLKTILMKKCIIILLLILSKSMFAQKTLDTIYANEKKNVALFFPNPIRHGITGADHFVFSYNREKEQYFGLLQATPGTESNLLTITSDGQVYSYILKYSNEPLKLNYSIPKNKSIWNEKPLKIKLKQVKKPIDDQVNRINYFQKFSEYLLNIKHKIIASKYKKGIKLQLQKMVYNASEVYLVIEVKNNSGIDFEVNYLNIYRTNGNKKRNASSQRLQQEVLYNYKMPLMIKDKESKQIVYVLPKFVLTNNEKLQLELQELKGSRNIVLMVKN